MNIRALSAELLLQVIDKKNLLSQTMRVAKRKIPLKEHPLLQEICYGVLRHLSRLESISSKLINVPLKGKKRIFHYLILVGIYQLRFMRIPLYASVSETVESAKTFGKVDLSGLINAVLRNYLRNQKKLNEISPSSNVEKHNHPSWILKMLQTNYPERWLSVINANNSRAPMWLRVNKKHHTRNEYSRLLRNNNIAHTLHTQAPDAIKLTSPCNVTLIPGFKEGWVSIQDAAAQLSINYLKPQDGELILDCCAAPGGKTTHILEHTKNTKVVAIDSNPTRLKRLHENLNRLKLKANVICNDARYPNKWWKGNKFDRILLDLPCSSTGIIRRHPDIKWLRQVSDISAFAKLQREIMDVMWKQLKPGGTMVYATCSIVPQENELQVEAFLDRVEDVILTNYESNGYGRQILPGEEDMDGFYYAVLKKQAS
ncbi:ribosomal RNA small subunit methyltransferase B [Candidatus Photodesmus blepharus]|uniref:16S rRNA (cytosine(967)-C(5))-methyltransferase n=1 Tax=Candidatus Photodesmus blepharonis TaxID=1179155 RepID=A0A084CN88_9GAMM|nr:16S rRNA (cytosine(967)-C(5))-methyltransferase RsmB [Candidatus Photodesmus blepharus]KEY91267.1 ribosomal RNA small subunit methyltransferase B [Candidatus Photodesmus blepharus]